MDQIAPSWLGEEGVSCGVCWWWEGKEERGRGRGGCLRGGIPFQCFGQTVRIAFYLEDLNGFVGGAGCETAAVVIEDCIVLGDVG